MQAQYESGAGQPRELSGGQASALAQERQLGPILSQEIDGVSVKSTADRVVDWIVEQIRSRRLVAGQRLVESALAKEFGVGTVPVREALRTLAGDGVVEITPNRGARIRVMSAKQIADMLKAMMGLFFVALDELENDPGRVKRIIPDLQEVCAKLEKLNNKEDKFEILESMQEYMFIIIQASENSYIMDRVRKFHLDYYNQQVLRFVSIRHIRENGLDHFKLTQALESLDFKRARRLLRASRDRAILDLEDRETA